MATIRAGSASLNLKPANSKIKIISQYKRSPMKNQIIHDTIKLNSDFNFKKSNVAEDMEEKRIKALELKKKFSDNLKDYVVDYDTFNYVKKVVDSPEK